MQQEKAIDIFAFALQAWKRRWWVSGGMLLGGFVLGIYAFVASPIYRATVVMVPAAHSGDQFGSGMGALAQLGGLASIAGINLGGSGAEVEEALAVLRSRQFIEKFIVENDIFPVLFPEVAHPKGRSWTAFLRGEPSMGSAYRYVSKEVLGIESDKKTGLYTLSIDWRDRSEAARWANDVVERINSEMRSRAIENVAASLGHLQLELEKTSDIGTREAINRLIEAQIRQRMLANVNKEYSFRVIDRAVIPELRDRVRPKRLLLVGLGCAVGFLLSLCGVLIADRKFLR